jgi:heat-inducible transcriptional repressor
MPRLANCRFKHLELVILKAPLILVVLVLRGARVKRELLTLDQPASQSELTITANKLNITYSGLTSSQISAKGAELLPVEQQITNCLIGIMQAEDKQQHEEICLNGLHFMLNQPEFTQSQRMSALVELIEQRNLLEIIVPPGLKSQGVQVIIGKENKAEVIQGHSVVISQYGLPEEAIGTIGVVGPTRMPYARTISTISYLSSVLSELVAELYGKEVPARLKRNVRIRRKK